MPPDTPRTMRRGALVEVTGTDSSGRLETRLSVLVDRSVGVDVGDPELAFVHLTQSNRERLLLHRGLDQRSDVIKQAFTELGVVSVDLASALRGEQHQLVLGV